MIILHVACLTNNKSVGPNINVPKNVVYGNKFEQVALYNCNDNSNLIDIPTEKIFTTKQYDSICKLPEPYNKPDIVVFHSIYILKFLSISKYLNNNNIPYIIVPRGSLTLNAQKKKRIKKMLGNLFFSRFISNAVAINFLTQNEYEESKYFDFKDYFILGNGMNLKPIKRDYKIKHSQFIVTFIGRIEWYHKGLDLLIEAINLGKEFFTKNHFIFNLYGPDDWGSIDKLNNMIKKYEIDNLVKINEPVFGKEKENILLNSDLFIHTSRLEGQPSSVIEAMSYGIPVIVTPGTNLIDIVKNNNLGFITDYTPKMIMETLINAYQNKTKFNDIGNEEIKYIKNNFDWNVIVKKNIEKYKKIMKKHKLNNFYYR